MWSIQLAYLCFSVCVWIYVQQQNILCICLHNITRNGITLVLLLVVLSWCNYRAAKNSNTTRQTVGIACSDVYGQTVCCMGVMWRWRTVGVCSNIWLLKQVLCKINSLLYNIICLCLVELYFVIECKIHCLFTQASELIQVVPFKDEARPLYLKTQPVPRCKHFSSRL